MSAAPLSLERDGELAYLYIDRPPRNVLSFAFFDALAELVAETLPGLDVSGLVLTGRGRHFSSGSDLAELRARAAGSGNESSPSWCEVHTRSFQDLHRLPYPVVAAIQGCCLGSGLELALACGVRVAADNALLALPEAQHGLMPGCGGTVALTELAGFRRAAQIVLTGEPVSAAEALELGVVDAVVPRRELQATAKRIISCKRRRRRSGPQ